MTECAYFPWSIASGVGLHACIASSHWVEFRDSKFVRTSSLTFC